MPFKKGHKLNAGRKFKDSRNKKISKTKKGVPNKKIRLSLEGKKFGRLSVIKYSRIKNSDTMWECKCDCGKTKEIAGTMMKDGSIKSCGCFKREHLGKSVYKHGMRDDPFYKIWCTMRYRCSNKKQKGYKNYGGRGIRVCDSWRVFLNFKKDMYEKYLIHIKKHGNKNTTIDRMENNGNYCKNNCKWSTRIEQNSNTRRNTIIEFDNKKLTMSEWARRIGVDRSTIYYRVFTAKWPLEKALRKNK